MVLHLLSIVSDNRQIAAFKDFIAVFGRLAKALASMDLKKISALFLALGQLFSASFADRPITPYKDPIDLSRFSLVWEDEFDHGFDTTKWAGHYVYGANDTQLRDTAFWNREQVTFTDDGCMKLTVEYKENGTKGPGYYSYGMETNPNKHYASEFKGYEQLYGYFEIRCILPKGAGLNPAFWLLTDGMWDNDADGGKTGAEVDVLETNTDYDTSDPFFGSVMHTIHVDGYEKAHKQHVVGWYYANNPYEEFNTYGVEWNSKGYTFYINGIETGHTDFGGVCQVPLYLIISVGVDEKVAGNNFLPASMLVDYVRCYQYK